MTLLCIGLTLFVAVHVAPTLGGARAALVARLGEGPYKGLYSLATAGALAAIVLGWRQADAGAVYAPPAWGRHAPFLVMLPVLHLLIGRRMGSNVKRLTAHPMLWAVVLWAASHLLANGDARGVALFGGFGGYALFAMWWQGRRGKAQRSEQRWPLAAELKVFAVAFAVYALLAWGHRWFAGVPLLPG